VPQDRHKHCHFRAVPRWFAHTRNAAAPAQDAQGGAAARGGFFHDVIERFTPIRKTTKS